MRGNRSTLMFRRQRGKHGSHRNESGNSQSKNNRISTHKHHIRPEKLRNVIHAQRADHTEPAAKPAHLPHPTMRIAHTTPEHIAENGDHKLESPNLTPLRNLKPSAATIVGSGQVEWHDDGKAVQRQIADHTHHRSQSDLAIMHQNGDSSTKLAQLVGIAHGRGVSTLAFRHHQQANQQSSYRKRQRKPQRVVLAHQRNGETRQICAEHANAERVGGPKPPHGRRELGSIDGLRHQHHERVDEQRVANTPQRIHA